MSAHPGYYLAEQAWRAWVDLADVKTPRYVVVTKSQSVCVLDDAQKRDGSVVVGLFDRNVTLEDFTARVAETMTAMHRNAMCSTIDALAAYRQVCRLHASIAGDVLLFVQESGEWRTLVNGREPTKQARYEANGWLVGMYRAGVEFSYVQDDIMQHVRDVVDARAKR